MYQRRVWSQILHSKFTNHTRPYRVTQHYCDYTTCFSCRHFHGAAEAATLDLFRPPVSESHAVSPVCHTVKLNNCVQHGPWHPGCPACLNIRSHPEAWDSSPPEAVSPLGAAALYFTERAYRVPRGGYSHRGSVSFGARCSCAFCLQFWQVELHLIKSMSDGHVCRPQREGHFLIARQA